MVPGGFAGVPFAKFLMHTRKTFPLPRKFRKSEIFFLRVFGRADIAATFYISILDCELELVIP